MRSRERRVLVAITHLLGRSPQTPCPNELAQVVGEAAGATGCALVIGDRRFQWADGDSWLESGVVYDGALWGTVALAPASIGRLPAVTVVLGALMAEIHLAEETDRLRRRGDAAARALADDRWRAAAEMEQERRSLEHDLHDGAQHHLVALRMSLALAEHAISAGQGGERIGDLLTQLENTERVLKDTAAGILPKALVADGLATELRNQLARYDNVVLDVTGIVRRHPAPAESAVYFVVLESVNNARKHAPGARVTVAVRDSRRGLEFTVADDGPGFVVTPSSVVLPALSMRAGAVGGVVEVRSTPGDGTTVAGFVPT